MCHPMGEFYEISKRENVQVLQVKDLLNEFANKEIVSDALAGRQKF